MRWAWLLCATVLAEEGKWPTCLEGGVAYTNLLDARPTRARPAGWFQLKLGVFYHMMPPNPIVSLIIFFLNLAVWVKPSNPVSDTPT